MFTKMGKRKWKVHHSAKSKTIWIESLRVQQGKLPVQSPCDLSIVVSRVELPKSSETERIQPCEPHELGRNTRVVKRSDNLCLHLHSSAIGPIKHFQSKRKWVKNYKPLPNGDCGDGIINPYGNKGVLDKYWAQRHKLFSKFDEGIHLDAESFFSVTPEMIAQHIAARMQNSWKNAGNASTEGLLVSEVSVSQEQKKCIVLDAFCGSGGNTIAFAKTENTIVIAVDHDRGKLIHAASNCAVYQIPPDRVIFIEGDVCEVLSHYKNGIKIPFQSNNPYTPDQETYMGYTIGNFDLLPSSIDGVFMSPPWGGPSYNEKETFTMQDLLIESFTAIPLYPRRSDNNDLAESCNGVDLLSLSLNASRSDVMFFLPRNIDGEKLGVDALSAGFHGQIELEQQILDGKLKTVTAYFRTGLKDTK